MRTVSIGVIGSAFGGSVHVPGFREIADVDLNSIASRNLESASRVAREHAIPNVFHRWEELVDSDKVDAISIATPPSLHHAITLRALKAGKSVLCEKPLALNADEAREMLDAARNARVVHMVDFEFREIPAWIVAKQVLNSGDLGEIRHVGIQWIVSSWTNPNRKWSWRSDRRQGGGVLSSLGVHTLDYIEWFFGPVSSMASQLSTRICRRPTDTGEWRTVTAEDCCFLMIELVTGVPISVEISNVSPINKGHWIHIYGEKKHLCLGSDNPNDYGKGFSIWESLSESEKKLMKVTDEDGLSADGRIAPFSRLASRFIHSIREHRLDYKPSFQDGYRAQVLMDLAVEADISRQRVTIPAHDLTSA